MLNGENDSVTPVQQAFLLQQRLTEVKHPDHTLTTYPNLGHIFIEAHSGLSHSFATTTSTIGTNASSLNTSTTSASSKG